MTTIRIENTRDFLILLFALLLVLMLMSCGQKSIPVTNTETKTITIRETIHDTAIKILADSSAIQYLIECNDNQARLIEIINQRSGNRAEVPNVQIKAGILTAKCLVDSMTVYNTLKSRDTTSMHVIEKTVTVEVNRLTWWQTLFLWAGKIALFCCIFTLLFILYRRFRR